jgi:GDPmannose 4,6-dehydratase
MEQKKAFISGLPGQDAAYLAKFLLEKGYKVVGGQRRNAERSFSRLKKMGILDQIEIVDFELLEDSNIVEIIRKYQFDEFYNLAAQSFVGTSFRNPIYTIEVNGLSVCKMLEAIRLYSPHTKFYQASTSEMFGDVKTIPQNEDTPFNPVSPYGCAKLLAHNMLETYRSSYGIFACAGILFNHESPLRGDEFVTKKITNYVNQYIEKEGDIEPLKLGNMYAKRDWGYAGDYVEAMWLMMQQEQPDTYVIATGKTCTVKDFVNLAFEEKGIKLEWRGEELKERAINVANGKRVLEISEEFYRPHDVQILLGDSTKAKEVLKWEAKCDLKGLVHKMVSEEF